MINMLMAKREKIKRKIKKGVKLASCSAGFRKAL